MTTSLDAIKRELRTLPGVMGVAIVEEAGLGAPDIQVFTNSSVSEYGVRQSIAEILGRHAAMQDAGRILVYQLNSPTIREEIERGRDRRPLIGPILVDLVEEKMQAHVSLTLDGKESQGVGSGPVTPNSMRVVAATTLEAAQAFLGQQGVFHLEGVSMVSTLGREIIVVLVRSALGAGDYVLGATLLDKEQVHLSTVQAALDAVNRQLSHALGG